METLKADNVLKIYLKGFDERAYLWSSYAVSQPLDDFNYRVEFTVYLCFYQAKMVSVSGLHMSYGRFYSIAII